MFQGFWLVQGKAPGHKFQSTCHSSSANPPSWHAQCGNHRFDIVRSLFIHFFGRVSNRQLGIYMAQVRTYEEYIEVFLLFSAT